MRVSGLGSRAPNNKPPQNRPASRRTPSLFGSTALGGLGVRLKNRVFRVEGRDSNTIKEYTLNLLLVPIII